MFKEEKEWDWDLRTRGLQSCADFMNDLGNSSVNANKVRSCLALIESSNGNVVSKKKLLKILKGE